MRVGTDPSAFTKAELRAAVDAADQWLDDNAASFNSALPVAFRTTANQAQKNLLVSFVTEMRAGVVRPEGL
jgi:hypothetical protein